MIEQQTIDGRKAAVQYLKADYATPASKQDYDIAVVHFEDGEVIRLHRQRRLEGILKTASPVRKANPYHDENGRFTTKEKAHSPGSLLDSLEKEGVLRHENGTWQPVMPVNGEPVGLKAIGEALGYTAKPKMVSKEEMDQLVQQGHKELFRGDVKPEYTTALKEGPLRYGLGIYGNGVYFAGYKPGKRDAALSEAQNYGRIDSDKGEKNPQLTRAVLEKDAQLVNDRELSKMYGAERDEIMGPSTNMRKMLKEEAAKQGLKSHFDLPESVHAEYLKKAEEAEDKALRFDSVYSDLGAYAAAKGYDAIHVAESEYVVLLNRSKLIVEQ